MAIQKQKNKYVLLLLITIKGSTQPKKEIRETVNCLNFFPIE